MEFIKQFIDLFLHLDKHLSEIISSYGAATYSVLFLIIFVETGLVIMPFLPGDSLLFAAGTFAALGDLNLYLLIGTLTLAAILGDTLNYAMGNYLGPKVFKKEYPFIKKEYLIKTEEFYEKHGGKTILFARFIPIIRTFAPFVAGVGSMKYPKFLAYNVVGALVWVIGFCLLGYFFGNIPAVKKNFTLVIFGIIFLSITPPIVEYIRSKLFSKKQ